MEDVVEGSIERDEPLLTEKDRKCLVCLLNLSIIIKIVMSLVVYGLILALAIKLLKAKIEFGFEDEEEEKENVGEIL